MDTICNSVIHEFDNDKFTLGNIKDRTYIIFKYMINSLVSEEYFKSIDYVTNIISRIFDNDPNLKDKYKEIFIIYDMSILTDPVIIKILWIKEV